MTDCGSLHLGFDLGASSGRAVVGVLRDRHLEIEEICRFPNGPVNMGGTLYWDLPALWSHVLEGMHRGARLSGGKVAGIGVNTWGVDFGLLAGDGRLLGNPICYRDSLAQGADAKVTAAVGRDRFYRLIGHVPGQVSTLSQLVGLRSGAGASRLNAADTLLMMPDLFRYLLCGHRAVELTAAGSSQMANARTGRWCAEVLRALRLPRRILPDIVTPGTVVGDLSDDVGRQTGLGRTPVVAVPGHDTAAAAAAVPFAEDDCAFISCGTWSVVGAIKDRPTTTAEAADLGFVNEFGLDSVLFVKNLMGLYLFENLRRAALREGRKMSYAQMVRDAAQAPPFACFLDLSSPLFFVSEDPEERIREFLRRTAQKVPQSPAVCLRAVCEGLAWSYRRALRDLGALTGRKLRRLCVVGGGIRNRLLCQMTADATGLEVIAGPAEATVAGNLAVQALATGALESIAGVRELVRSSFRLRRYRPGDTSVWGRHDSRCTEIMARSKQVV